MADITSQLIKRREILFGKDDSANMKNYVSAISKPETPVAVPSKDLVQITENVTSWSTSLKQEILRRHNPNHNVKVKTHANWKLSKVLVGHLGWVRSLCMEPDGEWFASGSVDSSVKIWDLASGELKLTLTGHIMAVRDIKISDRHPYMFTCSEDKTIKCWDLEKNKIVRDYYGHLSAVYSIDIHPTLDVLVSGGRDSSVRVWDMRTKIPVHVLTGHESNVLNVTTRPVEPQIISTSSDSTVRLWDLAAGKTSQILTNHKKSVRAICTNSFENSFVTGSAKELKKWAFDRGSINATYVEDFSPNPDSIVNTISVNDDGVLFCGGDDGSLNFYDYESGTRFQSTQTTSLPGSLDSESAIFSSIFDHTGLRLITGEGDSSIKVWKQETEV